MRNLRKTTNTYDVDNEQEANDIVTEYKEKSYTENYTVRKTKIDYKTKKDRKTGEIIEEKWVVEITVLYEE